MKESKDIDQFYPPNSESYDLKSSSGIEENGSSLESGI